MSKGIKSIKVSLRPVHLAIGDIVYAGIKGCMRKVVVKSEPYNLSPDGRHAVWVCDVEQTYLPRGDDTGIPLKRGVMCPGKIYLGDDGVEGYQYDDRPSDIGRTEEGAHMRYQYYRKWLASVRSLRSRFDL